MSRLSVLAAGKATIALVFVACGGSSANSGSPPAPQSAAAGHGGAGSAGDGAALAGGGGGLGGSAGQATAGGGGQAAGESPGGTAAAGGSSGVAGIAGAAGAQTSGGTGWIVPADPGAGWSGPQDPACPSAAVSADAACTSPAGTRCSYPKEGSTYTLRCQCYTSSTGAARWWCQDHASIGFDSCPVAYPGNGSCPNIGDVTCFYVDPDDKLEACNCAVGTSQCFPWGL